MMILSALKPGWWDKPIGESLAEWGEALSGAMSSVTSSIKDGVAVLKDSLPSFGGDNSLSPSASPKIEAAATPQVERSPSLSENSSLNTALSGVNLSGFKCNDVSVHDYGDFSAPAHVVSQAPRQSQGFAMG